MTARSLMFQGTGSNVGKSIIVAGLCRAARNRGIRVAPFKPQNMSNNAAVCHDGGEIGRAQALQANACGLVADSLFNPVLIKPQSDTTAQLIVHGQVFASSDAFSYMNDTIASLLPQVMESFGTLLENYDLVLVEGAGSPAETNLRQGDIANMGFAVAADVPVCMVADIDRGGVIASLVGTHAVLSPMDRQMIKSFIVNRFRGDITLFEDGVADICNRTQWWCAGVVPWLGEVAYLPQEDAVPLEYATPITSPDRSTGTWLTICVPLLSRIANFDDIDPLRHEPNVDVHFIAPGQSIPLSADVVVVPGTKSSIAEIDFIQQQGWDKDIIALARAGRHVFGLCGGYQILGQQLIDDSGSDGQPGQCHGLGLLNVTTRMQRQKTVTLQNGKHALTGLPVSGYEIHVGTTEGDDGNRPFAHLAQSDDGACNTVGNVSGTYLHGVFTNDQFRAAWLDNIRSGSSSSLHFNQSIDHALNKLADSLESALDIDRLFDLAT